MSRAGRFPGGLPMAAGADGCRKRAGPELGQGPRVAAISELIEAELAGHGPASARAWSRRLRWKHWTGCFGRRWKKRGGIGVPMVTRDPAEAARLPRLRNRLPRCRMRGRPGAGRERRRGPSFLPGARMTLDPLVHCARYPCPSMEGLATPRVHLALDSALSPVLTWHWTVLALDSRRRPNGDYRSNGFQERQEGSRMERSESGIASQGRISIAARIRQKSGTGPGLDHRVVRAGRRSDRPAGDEARLAGHPRCPVRRAARCA